MPGTFNGQRTKTADVGSEILVTIKLLQGKACEGGL